MRKFRCIAKVSQRIEQIKYGKTKTNKKADRKEYLKADSSGRYCRIWDKIYIR